MTQPTSTYAKDFGAKRFLALAAVALVGLGISVALTQHFYEVHSGTGGFKSFCNLGAAMNCDLVAASRYSELLPGLPLSSVAAGWFIGLFAIALFGRNPFWRREATRLAFAMGIVGSVFSLIYIAVMAFKLKTYCLLCLGVDVCTFSSLALAISLRPEPLSRQKPEGAKWKTLGGILAGSLVVAAVGLKTLDSGNASSADTSALVEKIMNAPVMPVDVSPVHPSLGASDAKVTIAEFSDFQCPFCRIGAISLAGLLNRHPGQVRVVFRAFPLDPTCNRVVQHSMHPAACESARVALCAAQQGSFESVYESLFENQTSLVPGKPLELAKDAGVDTAKLGACTSGTEVPALIAKDIEDGIQLNVESTPTFFINGHRVDGVMPAPVLDALVDRLAK